MKEFTICYTFDQYVITEKIVKEHDVQKETLEKEIIEKMECNPSFFVKNDQESYLIISSLVRYVRINQEKILIG